MKENIYKLEPGHYLLVDLNGVKKIKYCDLPEIDENNMIKDTRFVYSQFEELLTDSVRLRLRSDVPFGAFLSGGLDSSSIVALMAETRNLKVNTFTIGFPEKEFDESDMAKQVADKYNTNHHNIIVSFDSFEESLSKVIYHYDEPFGDSSAIPTGYVSCFAAQYVKMVLTGDGGDEALSGYTGFQGEKFADIYQKLPKIFGTSLPNIINSISPLFIGNIKYKLNRIARVFNASNLSFNERMIIKMCWGDYTKINALLPVSGKFISIKDYFSELFKACPFQENFYKMMYLNYKLTLPDNMLTKVDRISMAYSLETRIPFLDYRLIEFMSKVDKNVKMQGYERKSVLKNSVGKKLPKSLLKAPKKGFVVPVLQWFKNKEFESSLKSLEFSSYLPLNKKVLSEIISDHKNGKENYGNFIWMLLILNKWLSQ